MTPDMQAARERFRDQMPGLAEFDALILKYERLLFAQATLDQRWSQAAPAKVQALLDERDTIRRALERLIDTPDLPVAIQTALATLLKGLRTT